MAKTHFVYPSVDHVIAHLGVVWGSELFAIAIATINEGRVLAANPYFLNSMEYRADELVGRTTTEVDLWTDPRRRQERAEKILHNKSEVNEMVTVRTRTGKIKYFLVSSQLILVGGLECIVGTGTDITEEIDTKNRLTMANRELLDSKKQLSLAKAAAEAANMAKGAFLANMSHEIRTPLSVIQGFTEILLKQKWPEAQMRYLDRIHTNSVYLRELIDKVLDLSKIEAKEEPINPSRFVLGDKIQVLMESLSNQAAQKNIRFVADLTEVWNKAMYTDHIRLLQIIGNLCANAIKFTAQGRVDLKGEIRESGKREYLILTVKDSGMGIAKDKQKDLFKIFSQVHSKPEFGGTGLGLYLSRQLARKLGGDVELIVSRAGIGSTFEIRVRTELGAEAHAADRDVQLPNGAEHIMLKNLRILAAEDNESMRMIIEGMIKQLGGDVKMVQDGVELISTVERVQPHVILLDNRMPRMDGLEAARVLRGRGYDGKVIALTASAFEQQRDELIKAGCDDVLTKPFNLGALSSVLKKHLKPATYERHN